MAIRILGTGSYVPPRVLSNFDLEKMVETNDEWIRTRTGISQRRIAEREVMTSDLALEAAKNALDMAGIRPEDLDLISVATVSPDRPLPSTSCILQKKLGAVHAACYDVLAACSGLLYSIEIANAMLKAHKKYRYALVVGAEKLSSITDWTDRSTCILFGDGAGALVLARDDSGTEEEKEFFVASKLGSMGKYSDLLQIPAGGCENPACAETVEKHLHFVKMDGQSVFKLAVFGMVKACRDTLEEAGIAPEKVAWIIPHQANMRIIDAIANRLELPLERVFRNISKYGNTSSASIGLCLDELNRAGKLHDGDYVLLTAFGGGLTLGAMLIKWYNKRADLPAAAAEQKA